MTRPTLTHLVPGSFTRPNTRKSELCLNWGSDAEGNFFLREHLDRDDSVFEERLCGYLVLTKLPEAPPIQTVDDLRAALGARFDAHPLANQIPAPTELVERALANADALEVARVAARYACPAGVARGVAAALVDAGGGAYRSSSDAVAIKRFVRACMMLRLGTLDCHGSYGPREHWAKELFDELPVYPDGKHAAHDGGNHDDVCREYDRLLCGYLRQAAVMLDRAFELPPEKLDAPTEHILLPKAVHTPDEAIANLRNVLEKPGWSWQSQLADALVELHGQPFSVVRPVVAALLSGKSPFPVPADSKMTAERLGEGRMVFDLLVVLLAADLDLSSAIRAAAEQKAREDAEREARIEEIRRQPSPKPKLRWAIAHFLLRDNVFPFAILAVLVAIAVAVGVATATR